MLGYLGNEMQARTELAALGLSPEDVDWYINQMVFEKKTIKEEPVIKNFYFTFGSDEDFPYQNGFIVIRAKSEVDAYAEFRTMFPDRNPGVLNCSFVYTEDEWHTATDNRKVYGEPFATFTCGMGAEVAV